MNQPEPLRIRDFLVFRDFLTRETQEQLVEDIRGIAEAAPMVQPITPGGRKMSVRMTSGGRLGWVTDRSGYRYQGQHPNGTDWPAIPDSVLSIWKALSGVNRAPDCCLVNFYGERAKMGMHQDKDEGSFDWPVVSVSLGDDALFRMGSVERGGSTESIWLKSGDVVVMGGAARLAYHGVDRIRFASSSLLPKHGRINLTLRAVDQG